MTPQYREVKLTWVPKWQGSDEGPYSLLTKLLMANALTPKQAESFIAWKFDGLQGVNLLDPPSDSVCSAGHSEWANMLRRSSFAHRCPGAWRHLGQDARLRYCSKCMAFGYQPAVFQLSCLHSCPIHDEPLRERCERCNALTPPYRATASFHPRFECLHCCMPWGNAAASLMRWQEPSGAEQMLPWTRWIELVGCSQMQLVNAEVWGATSLRNPDDGGTAAKQEAFAAVMARLVPMSDLHLPDIDVSIMGPYEVALGKLLRPQAGNAYEAALHHLMPRQSLLQFRREFVHMSYGAFVPTDRQVPVDLHAWIMLRHQFERLHSPEHLFESPQTNVLLEPSLQRLIGSDRTDWSISAAVAALAKPLLDAVWISARRIAQSWHDVLLTVPDSAKNYVPLATNAAWQAQLGRWSDSGYSPVGIVLDRNSVTDSSAKVFLVVA